MTDIKAKTIADSVGERSPRLFTVETRAPTMIHQEVLRHRRIITEEGLSVLGLGWEPDFSYSVSSTRAVPFLKLLQEVRNPALRATPVHWGSVQKGMVPGDELDDEIANVNWLDVIRFLNLELILTEETKAIAASTFHTRRETAKKLWEYASVFAADIAEAMVHFTDPHKSIPNRIIAPYTHYNVLMTGTEFGWLNFFGLRLDGAADPIVRALAEAIWREWNESKPRALKPGEWHLPYADDAQSMNEAINWSDWSEKYDDLIFILKQMSVARCAHLSYTSFETGERMTVAACLNLYQRLVGTVPIHASPAEHQGTPDRYFDWIDKSIGESHWQYPEKAGNLGPGWVQLRKLLPTESVAPIPKQYR